MGVTVLNAQGSELSGLVLVHLRMNMSYGKSGLMEIEHLARRQMRLAKLSKKLDERKKALREKFFSIANEEVPDYMLPTTSVRVPKAFFEKTGYTHNYFLETRFPSWTLQAMTESEDEHIVFVLRKRKEYVGYGQSENGVNISRSVSEMTPEIDWDSMKKADPELFELFSTPVITYELNTEVFQQQMAGNPSFDAQGFLARHSKHRIPTLRVLAKEIKDDS